MDATPPHPHALFVELRLIGEGESVLEALLNTGSPRSRIRRGSLPQEFREREQEGTVKILTRFADGKEREILYEISDDLGHDAEVGSGDAVENGVIICDHRLVHPANHPNNNVILTARGCIDVALNLLSDDPDAFLRMTLQ